MKKLILEIFGAGRDDLLLARQQGVDECDGADQFATESSGVPMFSDLADQSNIDQLIDLLRSSGVSILSLSRDQVTLEDAFLQLIKEPTPDNQHPFLKTPS